MSFGGLSHTATVPQHLPNVNGMGPMLAHTVFDTCDFNCSTLSHHTAMLSIYKMICYTMRIT